ncbi:adenylosuccinate synthase [Lentilactobacillus kefiri]|jgi:adenylosuccinate synthase|uniref:adenylosuccinate synthase n=1 Tax=Lentilactobacillus kefiri TaxID=33962 RepID=UPI000BA73856|nr:adenylosuccinate synthase [Lentilactobacillus kefiri]MCJ2162614.1 adenylosuccinate synthase [Lentilactobacillus kefiri]MCP9369243.1 adenylosuccinate synthase [Lentilactobacillus kefiri]MDH5109266.1 adenylosuccinate synthase [Lentilactobacillus kefiri]MDM7492608.1 adenylosuccinate synthase [Lentilactobacillus kefiri]PAK59284.1 adenylosuccinate synthase [Lentilactobacillus kefiri]
MSSIVIVGSQWGDEGKGKITDFFGQSADIIARYQGGDNAGHTIVFNGNSYHLQLIPSGIFDQEKYSVIGNGVVVNPKSLINEMDNLKKDGISTDNLRISNRAQVIMPYHILFDGLQEQKKDSKIGTTNKGIGPAYMDKVERIGIRIADLLDKDTFEEKLRNNLAVKNELLTKIYDHEPLEFEPIFNEYNEYADRIRPYVVDASYIINNALDDHKNVLFEGAQGVMLDVDHGTYPFVTSSNPSAGGAAVGTGVGPNRIDHVIGVCKAYTSRVGEGPFPTELKDATGDHIREVGHEYGVVTKRPRRIGWFDSVVLRHSARVSGYTHLALNCLDILTGIKTLKICVAYELNGKKIDHYPATLKELNQCKPVYDELPGWDEDITKCKTFDELPANAQNYLNHVQKAVGVPYATFSVGPDRKQTNVVEKVW